VNVSDIRLSNGTQGVGRVLTSDISGNASWTDSVFIEAGWDANATATDVTVAGTYVKVNVLPVISSISNSTNWTTTSNRLNWSGTTRVMHIHVTASMTVTALVNYGMALYRNGVQIASSVEISSAGSTRLNLATQSLVQMNNGDFIEVFVTNLSSTLQDPTVNSCTFIITGV
jgi:hypothetical protein